MSTPVVRRRARLEALLAAQAATAVPAPASGLEIAGFRLYPVREPVSGRSWVVLRVQTRSGLAGYGECATASAADLAAAERFWMGRPATSYATAPLDSPLAGAIDIALLDITAQAARTPL